VIVKTATEQNAGTDAHVWVKIHGESGTTDGIKLDGDRKNDFEMGRLVYERACA